MFPGFTTIFPYTDRIALLASVIELPVKYLRWRLLTRLDRSGIDLGKT